MKDRYWLIYLLLVAVQIVLGNFLNLGQMITVCLLPLLVLSLPVKYHSAVVLFIAFATAMVVDVLTHGIPGLGTVALLPVAAGRRGTPLDYPGRFRRRTLFARGRPLGA